MVVIEIFFLIICSYMTCYVFYLLLLFVASHAREKEHIEITNEKSRFAILIPAHNENLFIGRLLSSVNSQNYPRENFKAVVIADNCTDDTALIAQKYGAMVYERFDSKFVGKGHALKYGIERIDFEQFDAVVIVDADCVLDKDVLVSFDKYLQSGYTVLQAASAPANTGQSWFTRLSAISHAVSNEILLKGKKRLGLSIPLMGTGMCFSSAILKRYGWNAFSVGEDWEYYSQLLSDNHHIIYAMEAKVFHQESHNLKQATTQRMRWSSGRFAIVFSYGFKILFNGFKEMNLNKIDGSLLLLFPNPSLGINLTLFALIFTTVLSLFGLSKYFATWFLVLLFTQVCFFMLGILYTKEKLKNLQAIIFAPVFLVWKIPIDLLSIFGMGRNKWIRTKRSPHQ